MWISQQDLDERLDAARVESYGKGFKDGDENAMDRIADKIAGAIEKAAATPREIISEQEAPEQETPFIQDARRDMLRTALDQAKYEMDRRYNSRLDKIETAITMLSASRAEPGNTEAKIAKSVNAALQEAGWLDVSKRMTAVEKKVGMISANFEEELEKPILMAKDVPIDTAKELVETAKSEGRDVWVTVQLGYVPPKMTPILPKIPTSSKRNAPKPPGNTNV